MLLETPAPTEAATPTLPFEQVVNFANAGALADIVITNEAIIVILNPAFDVSGLGTSSHAFVTTLPPGQNSVEEALRANGVEVNGPRASRHPAMNAHEDFLPYNLPDISDAEIDAVVEALRSAGCARAAGEGVRGGVPALAGRTRDRAGLGDGGHAPRAGDDGHRAGR